MKTRPETSLDVDYVNEVHPRDFADAEYDLLQDLGGMYSDMHKELYGRRPKIPMFKTVEEAEAAVEEIWAEYAAVNRAREEQERQDLEYMEMERRMQELMPGEYDIELPLSSGMGRRSESLIRVTLGDLRSIIREALDGHPYDGPIENLPSMHANSWGHGAVVSPKSWRDMCNRGRNFTRGNDTSILKRAK